MTDKLEPSAEPSESMTLEPPGRLAVVGAGALGVEAALYGRFLGYDVTLIAAHDRTEIVDGVKVVGVRASAGRLGRMLVTTWRVFRTAIANCFLEHCDARDLEQQK